ncbi:MAG: type IV toxin-antitoxin system AbiEi family antitoxin domain-containing protein, partial [Nocardioides sp.]
MDTPTWREVMLRQDGVVSRLQARDGGLTDADIRRLLRRREWARVHPGVFVNHTGPTTWQQ